MYEAKRAPLDQLRSSIQALEDQVGVVVEISGRPVALDLVSRPAVFADLLPPLANGSALQALHAPEASPSGEAAQRFLSAVLGSRRRWLPTPGMGDAFALTRPSIAGCGLSAERELVALSAFPAIGG
jgi:hypothetical protein